MDSRYSGSARPVNTFDPSRIYCDPIPLSTISVSTAFWLMTFISSIVVDVKEKQYPNFAWWALVFNFICIAFVTYAVGYDQEDVYSIAIVGFQASSLVFTSSAVNSLIYAPSGAKDASAAGFIILSIVSVAWILYYGCQPGHGLRSYQRGKQYRSRPTTRSFGNSNPNHQSVGPQMYTSAQLNGFETSSSGPAGYAPETTGGLAANHNNPTATSRNSRFGTATGTFASTVPGGESGEQPPAATEYPYKAKAIYSYEANPDDANEISFQKHEILDVSDVSGRWWQAKKENGETGIAPSNYLILL